MNAKWIRPFPPFRLADDLCYVGTDGGPAYLLATGDGLVMIDASYPETFSSVTAGIRQMGYDPADIRHILLTHGHLDHVGGAAALAAETKAKIYIGAPDADAVAGKNDLIFADGETIADVPYFTPDVLLSDGDVLRFGNTEIRCVSTAGHTAGAMSLFFPVHLAGKEYRAGMFGGAGLNTLTAAYLDRHGLPRALRSDYLRSIEKIYGEPVEFHVGNHLSDNRSREKMKRVGEEPNPFLAENTYRSFLETKRTAALELFRKEP